MCTADATAHIVENPLFPAFQNDRLIISIGLIVILGAVFMHGFQEAIKFSFALVAFYLLVNVVTLAVLIQQIISHPDLIASWSTNLANEYASPLSMVAASMIVFPQLALGLSGFETGVAVMPLVKTNVVDDLAERIVNTRKLLVTVAVIMSVFLLIGSFAATLMIPKELFAEGGEANGRALAYLTHLHLGHTFGSIYDLATVLILWFAGASGMAALLSLVPQYLPRYGMAPTRASARRPLVLFFTLVSILITVIFKANVDSQAGAFATGLLVLITSAAVAVTISIWSAHPWLRIYFSIISLAFLYASGSIIIERPDGLQISLLFIATILFTSFMSRAWRSTELRIGKVHLDDKAEDFVKQACSKHWGEIRLLSHRPDDVDYHTKERAARRDHSIQKAEGNFIFLEVELEDVSEFHEAVLEVTGHEIDGYQILKCKSFGVPNAMAALLLHLRDNSGKIPHAYLAWTEGHPLAYILKFVLFGEGETAPLTREILRSAEPDPEQRPKVHVA